MFFRVLTRLGCIRGCIEQIGLHPLICWKNSSASLLMSGKSGDSSVEYTEESLNDRDGDSVLARLKMLDGVPVEYKSQGPPKCAELSL